MSTQITITDGVTSVTMPKVKKISVGGQEVGKEITMASGKNVKEVVGHRAVIKAEWDYVPAATIVSLIALLRQGGYFNVTYPDPDGTEKTAYFDISYPTTKIFKFIGSNPMWHDVSLTMTAQEVV